MPDFFTERLRLRPFRREDSALLQDLDSDPDVMRFINGGKTSTAKEIAETTERILKIQSENPGYGFWMAFTRDSDEFLGWFLFRPLKNLFSGVEIGYRLKKKFWGAGYASEGSRRLLTYGFSEKKLDRIFAITHPEHTRSQNVLLKMGMKFVDQRLYNRLDIETLTVNYYECTAEEFSHAIAERSAT